MEPCRNEHCGANEEEKGCFFVEEFMARCKNYTTTPTVSIPKSELGELQSRLSKAVELAEICQTRNPLSKSVKELTEYLKEAGK
jgi:hypothetical protein